jgi:hypothetical protein
MVNWRFKSSCCRRLRQDKVKLLLGETICHQKDYTDMTTTVTPAVHCSPEFQIRSYSNLKIWSESGLGWQVNRNVPSGFQEQLAQLLFGGTVSSQESNTSRRCTAGTRTEVMRTGRVLYVTLANPKVGGHLQVYAEWAVALPNMMMAFPNSSGSFCLTARRGWYCGNS